MALEISRAEWALGRGNILGTKVGGAHSDSVHRGKNAEAWSCSMLRLSPMGTQRPGHSADGRFPRCLSQLKIMFIERFVTSLLWNGNWKLKASSARGLRPMATLMVIPKVASIHRYDQVSRSALDERTAYPPPWKHVLTILWRAIRFFEKDRLNGIRIYYKKSQPACNLTQWTAVCQACFWRGRYTDMRKLDRSRRDLSHEDQAHHRCLRGISSMTYSVGILLVARFCLADRI